MSHSSLLYACTHSLWERLSAAAAAQKYGHLPKMAFVLKLRAWAQVCAFTLHSVAHQHSGAQAGHEFGTALLVSDPSDSQHDHACW